nr:hypothetical protein [Tanacetum cinerariifolium]
MENGATLPKTQVVEGVTTWMLITTVEEKAQRRLEVKARSTLMMGIFNEHQLKFNSIKDAKQLLEAVEKRFGKNAATKNTQRNLLKQQYENFTTSSSKMLDQTFDRIQKLVSQLELLGEKLSQADVNQKLLRSLSPEWNTHAVVWRNKVNLDTMNMDDLYNLKVFDKSNVECYNCHKRGHFARECRALRNQDNKHKESSRRKEGPHYALMAFTSSSSDSKHVAEKCEAKSSEEETKAVRKNDDAPIIEEWVSDNEEENVTQPRIEMKTVRTPTLSFMRPFECPVTILNTIDHLRKFDRMANEGFFVGYSLNSKAFRVFNSRTRIVEENLHIRFSESTPNFVGSGPDWLFDIDALKRTMNYELIVAGTQSNSFAGIKASDNASQARKETEPVKDYILLPLWTADPPFSHNPKISQDDVKKVDEDPTKENECKDREKEDNVNSTNIVNIVSLTVNAADTNEDNELPFDPNMHALEDVSIFNFPGNDKDDDAMDDMNNLDITIQVSPTLTRRIHKNHPLDQVIRDLHSATQTRNMSKNLEEHGFVSTIQQRTNHKNL